MELVILKAKSRHGKNRIKQHGECWVVQDRTDREMNFVNLRGSSPGRPPWISVGSIDCTCQTCEKWGQDSRWISETNDPDFEIVRSETDGS